MTPTAQPKRRGRPRKQQSFAEWMMAIDAEVSAMVAKVEHKPPTYADLHPAQKRIVEMLIEHMRSLPKIREDEGAFDKREYDFMNIILRELHLAKYPQWKETPRCKGGSLDVGRLPDGGRNYTWMLRNCAGHAPIRTATPNDEEDD